jgi:hypothetical protein
MQIYLPDDLIERVREHFKKTGWSQPVEMFIEEAVDLSIENYPWSFGDICVHNDECMHWKTVEEWKEEGGKL